MDWWAVAIALCVFVLVVPFALIFAAMAFGDLSKAEDPGRSDHS